MKNLIDIQDHSKKMEQQKEFERLKELHLVHNGKIGCHMLGIQAAGMKNDKHLKSAQDKRSSKKKFTEKVQVSVASNAAKAATE